MSIVEQRTTVDIMMFPSYFEKFFADFSRIYKILPKGLQRSTLGVFGGVLLQAILEVGGILGISFLAISIAAPEKLFAIEIVAEIFHVLPWLQPLKEEPRLFAMCAAGLVACLMAAKNGMTAFVTLATTKLGERIALFAGETIFAQFLHSTYTQYLAGDSNSMFQALSWRCELGRMIIHLMAVYSYMAVVFALVITLVCATPGVILMVMGIMLTLAILVYKLLRGRLDQAGIDSAEWSKAETSATLNAMQGIREILIYRQQGVFFDNFRKACVGGVPDRAFIGLAPTVPTWVLETSGFFIIVLTLWVMYELLDASMGKITGVLTMIMLVSWRVLPLLNRSLTALVTVRSSRHAALNCLVKVEEALQSPAPVSPEPEPGFAVCKSIDFSHVSFRYPAAEENCLRDVNFTIPCGSRVGIIGQSGAGKSSVANILCGLVDPTGGCLLVDGMQLSPSRLSAYRQCVGYVPQAPYILEGSLAENVAFSHWGKPWDEEKVLKACVMAELEIAIQRGINTPLGQGGAGLSGGQAQRLSIARALYAEPAILILDEATSALDTGLETAIMNTIFALPQSITTITIAHRLTTVERCDSLIWLDGGEVRMTGVPKIVLPEYQLFLEQRAAARQKDK